MGRNMLVENGRSHATKVSCLDLLGQARRARQGLLVNAKQQLMDDQPLGAKTRRAREAADRNSRAARGALAALVENVLGPEKSSPAANTLAASSDFEAWDFQAPYVAAAVRSR